MIVLKRRYERKEDSRSKSVNNSEKFVNEQL